MTVTLVSNRFGLGKCFGPPRRPIAFTSNRASRGNSPSRARASNTDPLTKPDRESMRASSAPAFT